MSRSYCSANGIFRLDRAYDENFIPATPGFPGPTRALQVASRFADFNGINPKEGWRTNFDRETKTLLIDARRNPVDGREFNILLAQMRAEHDGVSRVVLLVCQNTLTEQGMVEFTRNGFEPQGYVTSGQFKFVSTNPRQWKTHEPQKLSPEQKADKIKQLALERKRTS